VEVVGIEPTSFSFSTGLLRAQPAGCLGPLAVAGAGERPQPGGGVPSRPAWRDRRV